MVMLIVEVNTVYVNLTKNGVLFTASIIYDKNKAREIIKKLGININHIRGSSVKTTVNWIDLEKVVEVINKNIKQSFRAVGFIRDNSIFSFCKVENDELRIKHCYYLINVDHII